MVKKLFYRIIFFLLLVTVVFLFIELFHAAGIYENKGNISLYETEDEANDNKNFMRQGINFIRDQCSNYTGTEYWRNENPTRDQKDLMRQRIKFIRDKCRNYTKNEYWHGVDPSGTLYTYGGVTYCSTPKVGCTHWLQVLKFLAKDFKAKGREITKPSDIDRIQVHSGVSKNIIPSRINSQLGSIMLSSTQSFMFTRHPFTRLWSAYIDKLFLPDFWRSAAVDVAKLVRQTHTTCVSDISFEEFIKSIVITPVAHLNIHWKPVHLICSPCHAKFDVIGKQETFDKDSAFIIENFGLHGLEEESNKNTRSRKEIKLLATNYLIFANENDKDCFEPMKISQRLWQAFQINGYIHTNISLPVKLLKERKFNQNKTGVFLETIFEAMDSQNNDMITELKHQKRSMMTLAYKSLPPRLLDQLTAVYKYDFELFQYDTEILEF